MFNVFTYGSNARVHCYSMSTAADSKHIEHNYIHNHIACIIFFNSLIRSLFISVIFIIKGISDL